MLVIGDTHLLRMLMGLINSIVLNSANAESHEIIHVMWLSNLKISQCSDGFVIFQVQVLVPFFSLVYMALVIHFTLGPVGLSGMKPRFSKFSFSVVLPTQS